MKPSDHLFRLYKSLNKSEKRYFTLFTQLQKGDKLYMSIVHSMDKMKVYDEEKVKKDLSKKQLDIHQLSVTKNYLYQLILKSLRSFHDEKTIDSKLNNLITDIKLLEKKGLYNQYEKKLLVAKKLSTKYERFLSLHKILDRQILFALGRKNKALDQHIAQLYEALHNAQQKVNFENKYKEILHQIFIVYRTKNKVRTVASQQKIKDFLAEDLLKNAGLANTFQTKICFFFSHALIQHMLGQDLKKANQYYAKVVEIWDRYPHMISENYKLYKIHLSNYLNSCHSIQHYKPFPAILKKIEQLPAHSFDEKAEEFQSLIYLKLLLYMNTFQHEQAILLIPKIEKGINRYQNKINKARELMFYYNLAILYFVNADFNRSLSWINNILDQTNTEHRKDIQLFARVLQVILHYEMNNHVLLESLYRSNYRGLKKTNSLYDFEQLTLQLIKKLQTAVTKKETKELFKSYCKQINTIKSKDIQRKTVGINEVLIWATGKLEGRSSLELLRESKE